MDSIVRMPLEGGGSVLFEGGPGSPEGPVKAGRLGDAVRELPSTLQTALVPIRDAAGAMLNQLRQAGPDEIEVEFGIDLAAQTGAVITKAETGCHVTVRMAWHREGLHGGMNPEDATGSDRRAPQDNSAPADRPVPPNVPSAGR
ncbi:CU044_2847 family protein [Streptomyces sp. 130]|uniref:CU044_2847 family protein n=1 Tax=Streptomyces sp. 130 TaxID=2591006 RepID=UPI001C8F2588|nr:CU044_2847 family protein [Streptomyces sp. 130]